MRAFIPESGAVCVQGYGTVRRSHRFYPPRDVVSAHDLSAEFPDASRDCHPYQADAAPHFLMRRPVAFYASAEINYPYKRLCRTRRWMDVNTGVAAPCPRGVDAASTPCRHN